MTHGLNIALAQLESLAACGLFCPDPRGTDPRGTDPRGTDPRGSDPRGADRQGCAHVHLVVTHARNSSMLSNSATAEAAAAAVSDAGNAAADTEFTAAAPAHESKTSPSLSLLLAPLPTARVSGAEGVALLLSTLERLSGGRATSRVVVGNQWECVKPHRLTVAATWRAVTVRHTHQSHT